MKTPNNNNKRSGNHLVSAAINKIRKALRASASPSLLGRVGVGCALAWGTVVAQVNLTLSAPRSQGGTVVAASSITLKPGFSFVASSGNSLSLKIDANATTPYASGTPALSQGQNYILTRTYKTDDGAGYMDQIQYFDGLGRRSQTVQAGASPSGADLVTYQEYDGFGRESNAWLPRPAGSNNGAFVPLASFTALPADSNNGDTAPYSNPVYEPSPLNRVQEQFGPGQEWRTNGKSVKTEYLTNTASGVLSCALYEATSDGLLKRNGSYPAGQLYVTKTTSEEGNASYEFKDKLGQVVLTRQGIGISYSTYYVYDDFGKLRFVLPPMAANLLVSNTAWNLDNQTLKNFAYIYKYDGRLRCVWKKLPGCEPIYFVYDKADRLVLTQDGEIRKQSRWQFNKYDALGRVVISGVRTSPHTQDEWASLCKDIVVVESRGGNYGYTWNSLPEIPYTGTLQVNHYDNYDELLSQDTLFRQKLDYNEEPGYGTRYLNSQYGVGTPKGQLVGTRTMYFNVDGNIGGEIVTATYYDYRGRIVQTKSTNHLGGTEAEYIAYDFTGHPIQKKHVHTSPQAGTVTELYTYTYDHTGRPTETRHSLNGGAEQLLTKLSYDELGRVHNHKAGNSAVMNTAYAYNVRSWTNSMDDPKFKETLVYGYDGNISRQTTFNNGVTVNYDFTYDELSRLTHAVSSGTFGNSRSIYYRYDEQGNIIDFIRDVNGNQADVSMQYNGNQLKKATDYSNAASSSNPLSAGFADYANLATEYAYNANGAMTKDLNKGISNISYNLLNLPQQVDILSPIAEARNSYSYSAAGQKLRVVQRYNPHYSTSPVIGSAVNTSALGVTKTTDYVGSKVFENNALKRILVDGGYIENGAYYFYISDHLGNNRVVVNQGGSSLQNTDYYPFGKPMQHSTSAGAQPYKFGGKEYDTMHGVDWYDFEARMLGTDIPAFPTADPLCEKYYSWSPYAYCMDNPVRLIDPTGMYSTAEFKEDHGITDDDVVTIYQAPADDDKQKNVQKAKDETKESLEGISSSVTGLANQIQTVASAFWSIFAEEKRITYPDGEKSIEYTARNWQPDYFSIDISGGYYLPSWIGPGGTFTLSLGSVRNDGLFLLGSYGTGIGYGYSLSLGTTIGFHNDKSSKLSALSLSGSGQVKSVGMGLLGFSQGKDISPGIGQLGYNWTMYSLSAGSSTSASMSLNYMTTLKPFYFYYYPRIKK